jgi:nucleoside-diphosphate-sugar epimerase
MMAHLLIFGPGYTASRIAARFAGQVTLVQRTPTFAGARALADQAAVAHALTQATHILSSVPPAAARDPVLANYAAAIAASPARWIGYLSSTGVYGDRQGGWVDETAAIGQGRRAARIAADLGWQALAPERVRIFRLPAIYGPGRSVFERLAEGRAYRVDLPEQIFSRCHVDDIAAGVAASWAYGPAGIYNLADDLPASQNDVLAYACTLLGLPLPPLIALDAPELSAVARDFYRENRKVSNSKAKHLLNWQLRYPDYRAGLDALVKIVRAPGQADHGSR